MLFKDALQRTAADKEPSHTLLNMANSKDQLATIHK